MVDYEVGNIFNQIFRYEKERINCYVCWNILMKGYNKGIIIIRVAQNFNECMNGKSKYNGNLQMMFGIYIYNSYMYMYNSTVKKSI